jgi:hypothetical protein
MGGVFSEETLREKDGISLSLCRVSTLKRPELNKESASWEGILMAYLSE